MDSAPLQGELISDDAQELLVNHSFVRLTRGSLGASFFGDPVQPMVGGFPFYAKWALKKSTVHSYLALIDASN